MQIEKNSRTRPHANAALIAAVRCLHCGSLLSRDVQDGYCCAGCRSVHELLARGGLLRYYELRGAVGEPALDARIEARERNDLKWLEPVAARLVASSAGETLAFKLQGLRCAACVWLIQTLFSRQPGALRIVVNPGRGSAELSMAPTFPLLAFAHELEGFGYTFGELGGEAAGQLGVERDANADSDDLLLRTGICLALGGNAMMFSAAIYLGLSDGPVYRLLHALNFACASLAVLVGGPVFLRSAWRALSQRILHLDLPIAVGIVLTYGAAVWSFLSGDGRAAYYDSLAVFIGLMLLGHWLKERVVLRNQRQLLSQSGAHNVWVRRVQDGTLALVRAPELRERDELIVPAGDLVPVPSELCDDAALCSLDWINGESQPVAYARGSVVPAGAFNAGVGALHLRARCDFARSPLADLLARTRDEACAAQRSFWSSGAFSGVYVLGVLGAACSGFAYWTWVSGNVVRGLEVATAICVVTCPCAIGIATPLAYDLVLAGLRRAGLFVRTQTFLDRALRVKRVVFDKTGTLTTGRLQLADAVPLRALSASQRDVLYTLVAGSSHPKSFAVQRALETLAGAEPRLLPDMRVSETAGEGLHAERGGCAYRLGRRAWVGSATSASDDDLVFGLDGVELCSLQTCEALRSDARRELGQLARAGYATWILSGDSQARVDTLAHAVGVPADHALGGMSPAGKAQWIAAHDRHDLLMIGDGINDSFAVQQAFASGTPSIDRAFMPWRTDFYFVTPGLAPIGLALRASRALARVVRRNQVFAVAYNVATVSIALAGLMKPWMAAVLMPLSSIAVLTATTFTLSVRSRLWMS